MRFLKAAILILVLAFWCSSASAQHTYYVSISSGADANTATQAQSKSTPWAHLPGMATATGALASYTPVAGDTFILKGCDIWTNSNFTDTWTWSGTSGSHITITVDQTWFNATNCPSTWNRPIFDAGGAVMGGTECTSGASNSNLNTFIYMHNQTYLDWNWIEERGQNVNNGSCFGATFENKGGDHITLTNFYNHDMLVGATCISSGAAVCNDSEFFEPDSQTANNLVDHLVEDNSDGQATTGLYTGGNINSATSNSVIQFVSNALRISNWGIIANNNINHVGGGLSGNHPNCIETLPPGSGSTYYIYGNHIWNEPSGTFGCNTAWGNLGETDYIFNNVFDQILSNPNFPQAANGVAMFIYNNSVASTGGQCWVANGSPTTTFVYQNNHCMTTGTPTGSAQSGGAILNTVSSPTTTVSNNATVSITSANSQGYTSGSTYSWQPTSANCNSIATGCPIGAGTNLTSTATGALAPLANDTLYGCTKQTVSGVIESVCPARASSTRPTSGAWDADGYQFGGAATTTPAPATGMFATLTVNPLPAQTAAPTPTLTKSSPANTYLTSKGFSQDGKTFTTSLSVALTGTNLNVGTATCTLDGTKIPCSCSSSTQCVATIAASAIAVPTKATAHSVGLSVAVPAAAPIPVLQ